MEPLYVSFGPVSTRVPRRDRRRAREVMHPSEHGQTAYRVAYGRKAAPFPFVREQDALAALGALKSRGVTNGEELEEFAMRVGVQELWAVLTERLAW